MEPRPTVRTAEAGVGVQKPGGYAASAVDAAKLVEPEGTEKRAPAKLRSRRLRPRRRPLHLR